MPDNRLYRSREDRVIAGVCGGLAEYFNVDANLIRLAWALISFPGAIGLPLYLLAWILVPESPVQWSERPASATTGPSAPRETASASTRRTRWVGALLLILGSIFLLDNLVPWFHLGRLWPVALIVVGAALLARGRRG
ncbi:MAG: PspC domain-containing protein [Betaproteobacteria bacterium]